MKIRDPAIRKLAEQASKAARPKQPPGYAAYLRVMGRIAEARKELDGEDTPIHTAAEWAEMYERDQKETMSWRRKQEKSLTERLERHLELKRETRAWEDEKRAKREAAMNPNERAYFKELEEYLHGKR
jgi:hypothetical protein